MTRIRTGMPLGRKTNRSIKDHCRQASADTHSVELRLFLRLKTPLLILSQIHTPTGDGLSSRLSRSAMKQTDVAKFATPRPGPMLSVAYRRTGSSFLQKVS